METLELDFTETPVDFFSDVVAGTRNEITGVSIEEIAECFKEHFEKEEIEALIKSLQN